MHLLENDDKQYKTVDNSNILLYTVYITKIKINGNYGACAAYNKKLTFFDDGNPQAD